MTDNTTINPGTGGDVIATDDIGGGVKIQRVKVAFGVDGAAADVSAGSPLPITAPSALPVAGTFFQATQPISGTVTANAGTGTFAISAASLPLPTGAATSAKQDTLVALFPASLGQKAKSASLAVTLASDEDLLTSNSEYETVAASQTDQALGATGGTGDFLSHLVVVPATTSPGAVSIKDGAGSAITVFVGGASSVVALVPFIIALSMKSLAGAWKVTTGANVSVIGVGNFT